MSIESPEQLRELMRTPYTVSDQQWAAISAPLQPAVVIAGAGSGKTSLMAARVVYLVANAAVRPEEVLGLTFTTKAAAELATRIRSALEAAGHGRGVRRDRSDVDEEVLEPTVATYNAYAAALLSEHGLRIGHEPDTRVMADASRYQLAARAVARHTGQVTELSDSPKHVIDYIVGLESALSEHLVTPDDVREFHRRERPRVEQEMTSGPKGELPKILSAMTRREELLGLVEDYRHLKDELGLMDFSDQIALAARLADERREVGQVERAKYRVVLLDEYQDTSVAQAQMLAGLFSGPDEEHGRSHPVTAVGDPNQAIYGWRGASVSNIMHFGEAFPGHGGTRDLPTYPLTVNRRSDRRILQVANGLAAPLYAAFPQVRPLEPESEHAGEVRTCVHETYAGELAWLAGAVLETHQSGTEWSEIGVLTRDNEHAAAVFDALTAAGVPVEIVGLQGLLRLPEVAEVVATLTLLGDLTANDSLLLLLAGPRWAVGPRDLALLGRRARELAGSRADRHAHRSLTEELEDAVAGADPTEVTALSDALDDQGDLGYSPEARERFGLLAGELRALRTHVGEPLLDLVRRIIDTCGIDVELASSVSEAARARRENLDLFVKAVADFRGVDGDVSLPALLAYLTAEDELGTGLDIATPTEADSVKLLTVHRAKGLEWDAVFLPGVCTEKFPNTRGRTQWTAGPAVLPIALRGDARDLPALLDYDKDSYAKFKDEVRHHQAQEELRLGYVAFTRARHQLWVSSYLWNETRKTPVGPSPYQQRVRTEIESWGGSADTWLEQPEKGTPNPLRLGGAARPWPVTEQTEEARRRVSAAELVRRAGAGTLPDEWVEAPLDLVEQSVVDQWDAELERLLAEARADRSGSIAVPLPSSLSATSIVRLRDDPAAFARELARPMPREPSPSARFGTRFHAWVEARFGQQQLLDPDELPGRADTGIDDERELQELIDRFEAGPFADRVPVAVEPPFAMVLAGQVVRGRIDAVYADPDSGPGAEPGGGSGGYLVVDWKTNQRQSADPLQLALYRAAWAELAGVPLERVRAAFFYVRSGELVEPTDLPDRAALESLLG